MPVLGSEERRHAIDSVMRLGKQAIGWCLWRANEYAERFPDSTVEEQDAAAALDWLQLHQSKINVPAMGPVGR
jgi:hypothetical protein